MRDVVLIFFLSIFSTNLFAEDDYIAIANEAKSHEAEQVALYRHYAVQASQNASARRAPYMDEAFSQKEKVAKMLNEFTAQNAEPKKPLSTAIVFVSFSMPDQSLIALLRDADKIHASVVIRGLIDNDFKKTFAKVSQLVKAAGVGGIEINPPLFQKFNITKVPAVVARAANNDFDVIFGNIKLIAALHEISVHGAASHIIADNLLHDLEQPKHV